MALSKVRAAISALVDVGWASAGYGAAAADAGRLAARLDAVSAAAAPSVNPLVDLAFIADRHLGGAAGCSALSALVEYAERLMPLGLSPHPMILGDLYRMCHPAVAAAEDRGGPSWVARLLADRDAGGRALVPILDPAHLDRGLERHFAGRIPATVAGLSPGRRFLAAGLAAAVTPHPWFDPVHLHAERTGRMPAAARLADPAGLLAEELAHYLAAALAGRAPSPAAGFDEALYRARHPEVDRAIAERRLACGFQHFVAIGGRPSRPATRSGLDRFPEAAADPWWQGRPRAGRDPAAVLEAEAVRRLAACRPVPVTVTVDGHLPNEVRVGETVSLVVHGWAASPAGRIAGVVLAVGEETVEAPFQGFPRRDVATLLDAGDTEGTGVTGARGGPAASALAAPVITPADRLFSGFAVAWSGTAAASGTLPVSLRFLVARGRRLTLSAPVAVGAVEVARRAVRRLAGPPPRVAIAMATFDPDLARLDAQIASIRAQTLADWNLVVSDESTRVDAREALARHAEADPRIRLVRGPRRGFLGNFERALRHLDPRAPYVALADQDDVWDPRKLDRLLRELEATGAPLAYADMRIVDGVGKAIGGDADHRFFSWRRPHGHTARELLLTNTVSGTALLARHEVLRRALPIPHATDAFHDQWIALVAATMGEIRFVDEALQDYVQHGGNVLGHDSAHAAAASARLAVRRRALDRVAALLPPGGEPCDAAAVDEVRAILPELEKVWPAVMQRAFLAGALDALAAGPRPAGGRHSSAVLAPPALAATMADLARTPGTEDPRRFLALPAWLASGTALLDGVLARPGLREAVAAPSPRRLPAPAGARGLGEAIRADYRIVGPSNFDATILLPGLGDEAAGEAVHLAHALAGEGLSVRLAVTDAPVARTVETARLLCDEADGAGLTDHLAVEAWGDRDRAIRLGGEEGLVATDWSTAHIAHRLHPGARFTYRIRTWEPATAPSDAARALAAEAYGFPHRAIFSSAILGADFAARRIGVFAPEAAGAGSAVLARPPLAAGSPPPGGRVPLILCRLGSEPAGRGLDEILALALAVVFARLGPETPWRVAGFGAATEREVDVAGRPARVIAQADVAGYRDLLAAARVGVVLEDAPHLGGAVIDMAAAGLAVVTTAHGAKTAAALAAVSPSIVGVEPTPGTVAAAILAAIETAEAGAVAPRLDWPKSWAEALDRATVGRIVALLRPMISADLPAG